MITGIFEVGLLLCFAAAWPFNILKSWRSRTAVGVSTTFMIVVEIGYVLGMLNKVVNDDINYVFAFYIMDFVLVLINLAITYRNRIIDKQRGRTLQKE